MADPIQEEINKEVAAHKILIYGKGTKQMPMCGFTHSENRAVEKIGKVRKGVCQTLLLAQRVASEGPRWTRAIESSTDALPVLSFSG